MFALDAALISPVPTQQYRRYFGIEFQGEGRIIGCRWFARLLILLLVLNLLAIICHRNWWLHLEIIASKKLISLQVDAGGSGFRVDTALIRRGFDPGIRSGRFRLKIIVRFLNYPLQIAALLFLGLGED